MKSISSNNNKTKQNGQIALNNEFFIHKMCILSKNKLKTHLLREKIT